MLQPTLDEERGLWSLGYQRVAGLDEAGRGAWAGPVVAAAVVLPFGLEFTPLWAQVADSKQLTPGQREGLYPMIERHASGVGVGIVPCSRIDAHGILSATHEAMLAALDALPVSPDFLLIDYLRLPAVITPQKGLAKGDSSVLSIAAASIIAKVTRDRWMRELSQRYPAYGFERHKGYGTAGHRAALEKHGPCPEHRLTFRPLLGRQLTLFGERDGGS